MGIKQPIGGSGVLETGDQRRQATGDVPVIFVYFLLPARLLLQNHEIADECSQSHSLAGKPTVFQILTISGQYSYRNYLKTHSQDASRQLPSDKKTKKKTRLTTFSLSQMVWATTNKVGCAVHTCHNMNVWGSVWKRATYLVCNYSPK